VTDQPDPIRTDRRRARARSKLPPDAACVFCGETTPEALLMVNRSVLERHHPLGEGVASEVELPTCKNCHPVQTDRQLSVGVALRRERRSLPETLVSVLRALGVFFETLGARLISWAEQLERFVAALDREHPG
jgi:hypothetical protein